MDCVSEGMLEDLPPFSLTPFFYLSAAHFQREGGLLLTTEQTHRYLHLDPVLVLQRLRVARCPRGRVEAVEMESLVAGAVVNTLFFAEEMQFSRNFLVVLDNQKLLVWKVEEMEEGGGGLCDHWEIALPVQSLSKFSHDCF